MPTDIDRLIEEIRSLPPEDQGRLRQVLDEQGVLREAETPGSAEHLSDVEYQQ